MIRTEMDMDKNKRTVVRNLLVAAGIANVIRRRTKRISRLVAARVVRKRAVKRARQRMKDYKEGRLKGRARASMELQKMRENYKKTGKRVRMVRRFIK